MRSEEGESFNPPPGAIVQLIERSAARIGRAADGLCAALFALVFALFCYKVARRYLAGDAVAWADELSVVCFVWIVLIANGLVVPYQRQIAFDLLHRHLPMRWQRRVEVLRCLLIGGIFAVALPGTVDYIAFLWREKTPVLLWPLSRVYACFGIFAAATALRMGWRCARPLFERTLR